MEMNEKNYVCVCVLLLLVEVSILSCDILIYMSSGRIRYGRVCAVW